MRLHGKRDVACDVWTTRWWERKFGPIIPEQAIVRESRSMSLPKIVLLIAKKAKKKPGK